jgi:uncharacterized protein (TIGR04255 family)
MPFPDAARVIYKKNPLDNVICQIQFPPILKIEVDIPASFQEKIRGNFPNYNETSRFKISIPQEIMKNIPKDIISQLPMPLQKKNHEFISEDDNWKVNLTSTFIALSSTNYLRWEEFREKLKIVFDAFTEIYSPPHTTRIGLRYADIIVRSELGLTEVKWSELLKPHILGLLGSSDIEGKIESLENKCEIQLSDNSSKVRIITILGEHLVAKENCFVLDSDLFNEGKMSIEQVWNKLEYLHDRSSRLIRWSITDKLHEAMEPMNL